MSRLWALVSDAAWRLRLYRLCAWAHNRVHSRELVTQMAKQQLATVPYAVPMRGLMTALPSTAVYHYQLDEDEIETEPARAVVRH